MKKLLVVLMAVAVMVCTLTVLTSCASTGTLTLNLNDGTLATEFDTELTLGVKKELPTDLTKEGFGFRGWYLDEECKTDKVEYIIPEVDKSYTLYAGWTTIWDIEYVAGEGSSIPADQEYDAAFAPGVDKPVLPSPVRTDGYEFRGWFLDEALTLPADDAALAACNGYTTLYAKWEFPVVINYNTVGGAIAGVANTDYTASFDYPIGAINLPVPTGTNNFVGWYFDAEYTQPATAADMLAMKQNEIDLYARWGNPINVTYNAGGATLVGEAGTDYETTFNAGTAPTLPTATLDGKTWGNWYFDAEFTQPANANTLALINADVTLYLRTEAKYALVYVLDGGTITSEAGSYATTYEPVRGTGASLTLPMAAKEGYKFMGWFTDEALTAPATYESILATNSDAFLYAKFASEAYLDAYTTSKLDKGQGYFYDKNLGAAMQANGSTALTFSLDTNTEGNVDWATKGVSWINGIRLAVGARDNVDADRNGEFDNYAQPVRFLVFREIPSDHPEYIADGENYAMWAGNHTIDSQTFLTRMNSGAKIDVVIDVAAQTLVYYVDGVKTVERTDTDILTDLGLYNYEGADGDTYTANGKVYTRSNRGYIFQFEQDKNRTVARDFIGVYAYDIYGDVKEAYNVTYQGAVSADKDQAIVYKENQRVGNEVGFEVGNIGKEIDKDNPFITFRIDTKNLTDGATAAGTHNIGGSGANNSQLALRLGAIINADEGKVTQISAFDFQLLRFNKSGDDYNVLTKQTNGQQICKLSEGKVIDIVIDIKNSKFLYYVNEVLMYEETRTGLPKDLELYDYSLPIEYKLDGNNEKIYNKNWGTYEFNSLGTKDVNGVTYTSAVTGIFQNRPDQTVCQDDYLDVDVFAIYAHNIYEVQN